MENFGYVEKLDQRADFYEVVSIQLRLEGKKQEDTQNEFPMLKGGNKR
jgi:hypothetical protein